LDSEREENFIEGDSIAKSVKPKDSKTKTKAFVATRSTVIGDLLEKNPSRAGKLAETMLSYGLHCVGCHANVFDTIENGCRLHGMSDETIEKLLADVNAVLSEDVSQRTGVEVTDVAAEKIKELMEKENKKGHFLRVAVEEGGCAGHTYDLSFDNTKKDGDKAIESKGIKLVMSPESFKFMNGAVIDYIDSLKGAGFKIDNPNVNRSCKCGESFG
jgi:iron-sulfur cluster assembly protein